MRSAIAWVAFVHALLMGGSVAWAAGDAIDLKLRGREELGLAAGCSVTLWQANRDPDKDRFAIVFHERMNKDHQRSPAAIKIGEALIELRRLAIGGRASGYNLFEYQLYRSVSGDYTAILDLRFGDTTGEAVEIAAGTFTLVTQGKLPFRMAVKGGAGCRTAAEPPPPGMMFEQYRVQPNLVPRAMLAEAQKKFGCSPEVLRGQITAFQLSEESGIWEIPCDRFAYNVSSVFANVHVERPAEFTFIGFAGPPGRKREDPFVLLNAQWHARNRTVSSFAKGRGAGDCGTYEVHRVGDDARFRLVEYREKTECDGKVTAPEQYRLIYGTR